MRYIGLACGRFSAFYLCRREGAPWAMDRCLGGDAGGKIPNILEYLDFDLLIERSEGCYRARVINSPSGQAAAEFELPFSPLELENFYLRIGQPRSVRRRVRLGGPAYQDIVQQFGGRLYQAVFNDAVGDCLHRSLDLARARDKGLRLRLRLSEAPDLMSLPWEYLYDPSLNRSLALSVQTSLVRYVDLPEPITPLAVRPPLRMLVMVASPTDEPALDVEQEWSRLKGALRGLEKQGSIIVERLADGRLSTLQRQLRRGGYHILHYIGHGAFDPQTQNGVLLLVDEQGRGRLVSGDNLGVMLHDAPTLRMVVLNACEGARTSRTDPFSGVAQSVVQAGIPAVVAMQFEITDEAAITFAHEFYSALVDGYPVDAALAEARKGILSQGNDLEWGTPVLHMRAPEGVLFAVTADKPEPQAAPASAPRVSTGRGASPRGKTPWLALGGVALAALLLVYALVIRPRSSPPATPTLSALAIAHSTPAGAATATPVQ